MKSKICVAIVGCGGSVLVPNTIHKSTTVHQPQVETDTTDTSDTE